MQCPFKVAVDNNDIQSMKWHISKGLRLNPELMTLAINNESFEMVKLLHKAGVNFSKNILEFAGGKGSFKLVNCIIESGITLDESHCILQSAIQNDRLNILELILSFGVKPSKYMINLAFFSANFELIKLLFENSVYSNDERQNFILLMPYTTPDRNKITKFMEYILRNNDGLSESFVSELISSDSHFPILEILFELGANICYLSHNQKISAFLYACRNGCVDIVRFLLRNGADVRECDEYGRNCYLNAIWSGNLEIVKITRAFSDKNFVDNDGKGPFFYILMIESWLQAKDKVLELFDYLMAEGVNMNMLDKEGIHPLMEVDMFQHKLVQRYFEYEENFNFRIPITVEQYITLSGYSDFAREIGENRKDAEKRI